jgi:ParB family chromosome partitioning protein
VPDLLRRLAAEKLDAEAQAVRGEGWAWVEARIELGSAGLRSLSRCEPGVRAPTADEKRTLAELDQRSNELDAELQALDDSDTWTPTDGERIALEEQDIEARRKAIKEARQVWRDEDKARAGVIVTVRRDGSVEIIRGLVRPEDRQATKAEARSRPPRKQADESGAHESATAEPAEPRAPFSETLLRRLAAHRTAALQAVLAHDVHAPLVALTHALALQVFERFGLEARSALQITARPPRHELLRSADDLPAGRAWADLEARRAVWLERLPQAESEWLGWLAALPQPELPDLLGLCAASLALVPTGSASAASGLKRLAGLDMRQWWEPTPEAFLSHVSKAQIAQALKEGGAGSEASAAGMKKGDLATLAATKLAGKGWLPEPLKAAACT